MQAVAKKKVTYTIVYPVAQSAYVRVVMVLAN